MVQRESEFAFVGVSGKSLPTEEFSMTTARKHDTAQEKVAILRLHLLEQKPVSDLCDQYGLHPTLFSRWQKEFFENGHAAFEPSGRRRQADEDAKERTIATLEGKLQQKNEVLAELMQEYVQLKKELGEP
jgi:transposase-like protein